MLDFRFGARLFIVLTEEAYPFFGKFLLVEILLPTGDQEELS
jgi:hypothetical protein